MSYSNDDQFSYLEEGDNAWSDGEEPAQTEVGGQDPDDFDDEVDEGDQEDPEEEEEEGEKDEEEDEYESESRKRSKKRRSDVNMFLLEEAEVDDEDEEEEDDEEELGAEKFIANEPEEDFDDSYRPSRHLELERRRQQDEDFDAEKVAAEIKARHGRKRGAKFQEETNVPKMVQLADVNEPNMWVLKCKPGKEREICRLFLKNSKNVEYSGRPMEILSVSCRDSLKGYIYVEAWKLAHVQQAVQNIPNLYAGKISLVPLAERGQVLNVRRRPIDLKPNSWVKIKRGTYAGELAQIIDVAEAGDSVRVKLVRKHTKFDDKPNSAGKRKKPSMGGRRGYVTRDIKLTNLIIENISPTMDEINNFMAATDDDEERSQNDSQLQSYAVKTDFQQGDEVELVSQSSQTFFGFIESIEKNKIIVSPSGGGRKMTVTPSDIRKKFRVGDHVKVLNGQHKNETGMVVKIDQNPNHVITFISDTTLSEVIVFGKDLKKVTEVANATGVTSDYEMHDLVKIDSSTVGVIINIEPGQIRILDQNETSRIVEPNQILQKCESRKGVVTDKNGNALKEGDTVEEYDGENRSGKLLHIYKLLAFVSSRESTENGGIFVTRWKSLINKNVKSVLPALDKLNPEIHNSNPNYMSRPITHFPQYGNRGRIRGRGRGAYGYNRGRKDDLIDKTVTVVKGPFKGYIGIVKDTAGTKARVELHTNCRIINVEKVDLEIRDSNGVTRPVQLDYGSSASTYGSPAFPGSSYRPDSRASWSGSRTPAWNSMSPNPHMNDGSRTPAIHLNDGSRTPAHHYNDGSRTPAWDLGSRTPAWGADGSDTSAWDSGSKTPRWGEGARTPAYASDYPGTPASDAAGFAAPTPAPDTPGFIGSTPGETPVNYPEPSGPFSLPTPAPFSAPTPAPFSAPTPAPFSVSTPLPMTPANVQTPNVPDTPMNPDDYNEEYNDDQFPAVDDTLPEEWVTNEIEIRIVPDKNKQYSFQDGLYNGRIGVIHDVIQGISSCVIILKEYSDGSNRHTIPWVHLERVRPVPKDRIKITGGTMKGLLGILVGVDRNDGVVKIRDATDFKIISISLLAKYTGSEQILAE